MCVSSLTVVTEFKGIGVASMIIAMELRCMSLLSNDCCELEVDLRALNDRSYDVQMNESALDDDCLNLKWICVPSMIAATKLR
jgi:hypothetical protein